MNEETRMDKEDKKSPAIKIGIIIQLESGISSIDSIRHYKFEQDENFKNCIECRKQELKEFLNCLEVRLIEVFYCGDPEEKYAENIKDMCERRKCGYKSSLDSSIFLPGKNNE